MKRLVKTLLSLCAASVLLTGCNDSPNEDLQAFMATERAKRGSRIEPLPAYPPYVSTIYSAAGLRSPFEIPRTIILRQQTGTPTDPPDPGRPREFLERFNFANLLVVGSISMGGEDWALLADDNGSVHRVKAGMYVGQNYGKVTSVEGTNVEVVEIVPDGQGGWLQRPRQVKVR